MADEIEEKELTARIYEFGYLLVPTIELDQLAAHVTRLKNKIEEKGGVFLGEGHPNLMTLAYEMSRTIANKKTWFTTAYFGWAKFEIEPAAAEALEKEYRLDETLIRFLITKTVRENTMSVKRPARPEMKRTSTPVKEVAPENPITKEELDKEIDALVELE